MGFNSGFKGLKFFAVHQMTISPRVMAGGAYSYRRSLELEVMFFKEFYCTDSIYSVCLPACCVIPPLETVPPHPEIRVVE
jgi:hypothetical protein